MVKFTRSRSVTKLSIRFQPSVGLSSTGGLGRQRCIAFDIPLLGLYKHAIHDYKPFLRRERGIALLFSSVRPLSSKGKVSDIIPWYRHF